MKDLTNDAPVVVIGAGLAGCEAAWQLAQRKIAVELIDMKPERMTPAHSEPYLAELVCSNSLRSDRLENAVGLLKEEMRRLDSLIIAVADQTRVPAGGALAVDRRQFSRLVTQKIDSHPLICRTTRTVEELPADGIVIVATGPLTDGALLDDIKKQLAIEALFFFDAAAPIISADSIDEEIVFRQSRYQRGSDYLNCPLDRAEYKKLHEALLKAPTAILRDFENKLFEACLPIEVLAQRGFDTLRYGPLKPVGLTDPRTGKEPFAVVQLRQDDRLAQLYNLVGFQTRLTFTAQREVFSQIPGLAGARFVRYGVMHRNTYLPSPELLHPDYSCRRRPSLYFAGQITGVEGYVESASAGLIAGRQAALQLAGLDLSQRLSLVPPAETVIGSLSRYVSDPAHQHFQPMNANFGLLAPPEVRIRTKSGRGTYLAERSLASLDRYLTGSEP